MEATRGNKPPIVCFNVPKTDGQRPGASERSIENLEGSPSLNGSFKGWIFFRADKEKM